MVDLLLDNFNDNSIDLTKWEVSEGTGGTVTEQNQRLEINQTQAGGSLLISKNTHDLTKATIQVDVVVHESKEAGMFIFVDANNSYYICKSKVINKVVISRTVGGVFSIRHEGAWVSSTGTLKIVLTNNTIKFFENNLDTPIYEEEYALYNKIAIFRLFNYAVVGNLGLVAFDNFSATTTEVPTPPPPVSFLGRMINVPIIDRQPEE